jgi:hypothetical protein
MVRRNRSKLSSPHLSPGTGANLLQRAARVDGRSRAAGLAWEVPVDYGGLNP